MLISMSKTDDLKLHEAELTSRFTRLGLRSGLGWLGGAVKRAIDVIASAVGLAILAIPFLLVALAIRLDSPGTIFFIRYRVGQGGKLFPHWKFRTMVQNALEVGSGFTVSKDDNRITRVGGFLRLWSVDELPQLINVFLGQMSLVGPRPSWPHEVLAFDDTQLGKIRVRPGITGLAAVRGRNTLPWEQRIQIDNWYIDHWSVWLDLKVLVVTPIKVVTREGIYGSGGVNPSIVPHPPVGSDTKIDAVQEESNK